MYCGKIIMFFYYKIERKPINSVETKIVNHVTGNTLSHLSGVVECPMAAVRAAYPAAKINKKYFSLHGRECSCQIASMSMK